MMRMMSLRKETVLERMSKTTTLCVGESSECTVLVLYSVYLVLEYSADGYGYTAQWHSVQGTLGTSCSDDWVSKAYVCQASRLCVAGELGELVIEEQRVDSMPLHDITCCMI